MTDETEQTGRRAARPYGPRGERVSHTVYHLGDLVEPAEDPAVAASEVVSTILVVDDDAKNQRALARRLELMGHKVFLAESGRQALERARTDPIDLVMLDLLMPGLSGEDVLRELKQDDALRHVPVLMISGLDDVDAVVRCIDLGAEDYLLKPVRASLLRARIDASLRRKAVEDERIAYAQNMEAERRRSDVLLSAIFPASVIEELKATRTVLPRRHDSVAVLFCDVVDFTGYCDNHAPELVVANLQQMVDGFERIAADHRLEKIKTVGDSFLATAGLLNNVRNPVLNCVQSGWEMIEFVRDLPAGWSVRVGIHLGPLTAGVVGHRQYSFDIWGDTVNIADRVQSSGPHDTVTLTKQAWCHVQSLCAGESLGVFNIKGKGEIELFRVNKIAGPTDR